MMQPFFVPQVGHGEMPKLFQLVGCTILPAPPEPAAVEFMEEAQDDRYGTVMTIFKALKKGGYLVQPGLVQGVLFTAREDGGDGARCRLPGGAARERIIQMPADGNDAAPLISLTDICPHSVK